MSLWQLRQAFAQAVTSVERPFHTYLEEMRRRVARLPGWAAPWRCSNTCRRRSLGTSGRKVPVDESPMRSRSPTFWVMMRSPGLERRACTCGQRIWRRAISLRSRGFVGDGCADPLSPGGGRRRAGQRVRHHIRCTRQISQLVGVFGDESQVALLASRGRGRDSVKGENQWFVIRPQLEGAALEPRAEMFYT